MKKTKLIDLIGQLQDDIYDVLYCDVKVVICSFSSFHRSQTDQEPSAFKVNYYHPKKTASLFRLSSSINF